MSLQYYDLTALGSVNDLIITNPLIPEYPLGLIVTINDTSSTHSNFSLQFMYIKNTALSPMVAFEPVVIAESHIKNAEVFGSQSFVTQGAPIFLIAVPQLEILLGRYGFVQIRGTATCNVQGAIGSNTGLRLAVNLPTALKANAVASQNVGITIGTNLTGGALPIGVLLLGNKVGIPAT